MTRVRAEFRRRDYGASSHACCHQSFREPESCSDFARSRSRSAVRRDNHLVLRDNRASRNHARIVAENGEYYVEDLKSSHGVFVNGTRVTRQKLYAADRIEFGFPDSYSLIFTFDDDEIQKLLDQFSAPKTASAGAGNLAKLRALVEVARALQNSLSTDDVLAAVVDAALAITGFERGFLLLNDEGGLKRSACPRPPRQSGPEDRDRSTAR